MPTNLNLESLLGAGPGSQQGIGFVKVDGAPGEATATGFEGWIEINDFQQPVDHPNYSQTNGVYNGGTRQALPIRVWKAIDKSTPVLMQMSLENQKLASVTIVVVRQDKQNKPQIKTTLTNAHITKIESQLFPIGMGEWVSFVPEKIDWEYTSLEGKTTPASFDFTKATK